MSHIYLFFVFFLGITSCAVTKNEKPLNIVLILADDQGAHLSTMGTPGISTPNIDKLAENGMLFTNAFAVVASCSPSRSSIMTGMYPHANGHWRNTITPSLDDPDSEFGRNSTTVDQVGIHDYLKTLPEILQEHGYFTAITQKFHMSPPWKFPFSNRNSVHNDPREYKKVITEFIKEAGDSPFFFQANIAPPHRPFRNHMNKFPEYLPDIDSIKAPKYLANTPEMRKDLQQYYGAVQLADACAGAIIEALKESGSLENTMIIYTSDHGPPYHRAKASAYYAGLHIPFVVSGPDIIKSRKTDALVSLIDIMPTFLDYLEIEIPKSVQGNSLKAILSGEAEEVKGRTYIFGEYNSHGPARAEHYPSRIVYDGKFYYIHNLLHEKSYTLPDDLKQVKVWDNHAYQATKHAKDSHPVQYNLLSKLESGRPEVELYNMENDSGQLINLAGNPKFSEKLNELSRVLKEWRKATGDEADDPVNVKTRQLRDIN